MTFKCLISTASPVDEMEIYGSEVGVIFLEFYLMHWLVNVCII